MAVRFVDRDDLAIGEVEEPNDRRSTVGRFAVAPDEALGLLDLQASPTPGDRQYDSG